MGDSRELIKAAQDLGIPHGTSTPGRPQTNGVAERAARSVVEGTRTCLEHAGFPPSFWPLACRHFTFATSVAIHDGDSPWNMRHKKGHFRGPLIPFGCLVDFMQLPSLVSGQAKFAPKATPGLFLGYHLLPGGCGAEITRLPHLPNSFMSMIVLLLATRFLSSVLLLATRTTRGGLPSGLRAGLSGRVRVQRVRENYLDAAKGFIFPLKQAYEKRTRSLPGPIPVVEATAFDCPGADPVQGLAEETRVLAVEPVLEAPTWEKGAGGTFESGRFVRSYRETTRPPHVLPEAWQAMSPKWKKITKPHVRPRPVQLQAARVLRRIFSLLLPFPWSPMFLSRAAIPPMSHPSSEVL